MDSGGASRLDVLLMSRYLIEEGSPNFTTLCKILPNQARTQFPKSLDQKALLINIH
jgi:hypothetical protein